MWLSCDCQRVVCETRHHCDNPTLELTSAKFAVTGLLLMSPFFATLCFQYNMLSSTILEKVLESEWSRCPSLVWKGFQNSLHITDD